MPTVEDVFLVVYLVSIVISVLGSYYTIWNQGDKTDGFFLGLSGFIPAWNTVFSIVMVVCFIGMYRERKTMNLRFNPSIIITYILLAVVSVFYMGCFLVFGKTGKMFNPEFIAGEDIKAGDSLSLNPRNGKELVLQRKGAGCLLPAKVAKKDYKKGDRVE